MNRRGWCPGALSPMPTGDGLLVRLRLPVDGLTPARAKALAEAARRHGNGLLDLSSRGNLQIRGARPKSLAALQAVIAGLGLLDGDARAEAVRNVTTNPLAGLDPLIRRDPRPLAAALDACLASEPALWDLPPKLHIVVDGGGRLPLDDLAADLRLTAAGQGWAIRAADVDLGVVAEQHALEAVLILLRAALAARTEPDERLAATFERIGRERLAGCIAALVQQSAGAANRGPNSVPELVPEMLFGTSSGPERLDAGDPPPPCGEEYEVGVGPLGSVLTSPSSTPLTPTLYPSPPISGLPEIGRQGAELGQARVLWGGRARAPRPVFDRCTKPLAGFLDLGTHAGVAAALPFGRIDAGQLAALADLAIGHGAALRLTPWRAVLLAPLRQDAVPAVLDAVERIGLIVDPQNPRLSILACAGRPACASAGADVRADAHKLLPVLAPWLSQGETVHLSGCAKGCASRKPSAVTLTARDGRYGLAFDAAPSAPVRLMSLAEVAAALRAVRPWPAPSGHALSTGPASTRPASARPASTRLAPGRRPSETLPVQNG